MKYGDPARTGRTGGRNGRRVLPTVRDQAQMPHEHDLSLPELFHSVADRCSPMNRMDVLDAVNQLRKEAPEHYAARSGWMAALNKLSLTLKLDGNGERPIKGLSRRDDPGTSAQGAQLIAPKRGTRKAEVLDRLQQGGWIPGHWLQTPNCGGSEGLRRVRELRDEGWNIRTQFINGKPHYQLEDA